MKLKVKGSLRLDVALRKNKKEYMVGIDLLDWYLFTTKRTEMGFWSLNILCFTFATLDRNVFDRWLDGEFTDLFSVDPMANVDHRRSVRQDVM